MSKFSTRTELETDEVVAVRCLMRSLNLLLGYILVSPHDFVLTLRRKIKETMQTDVNVVY